MDPLKTDWNQVANAWIRRHFVKRECICVCPMSKDSNKCGCGRYLASHYYFEGEVEGGQENPNVRWNINKSTATYSTQEFGSLSFQGVHGPNKSHFIRLDFTTEPADIYHLLTEVWGYEPPKLIISVHGGTNNFELTANLSKALRRGLLKTAKTTNAWIITSGIRMGVVKHIIASLTETIYDRKAKFTLIGILPWGVMRRSEDLINSNGSCVPYYLQPSSSSSGNNTISSSAGRSKMVTLCENHSCFLLVDNGMVGRGGAEVLLRRRFEEYLRQRQLGGYNGCRRLPLVGLVLGGGKSTIQAVVSYVTSQPPVPVVVCAGSGRAADVLAYAKKHGGRNDNESSDKFKRQLLRVVESFFGINESEAHKIYKSVLFCSKLLNQMSVFSADKTVEAPTGPSGSSSAAAAHHASGDEASSSDDQELDRVILNTLLEAGGQNLSPVDKLGLLLAWNRDDMARHVFERCQSQNDEWPEQALCQAMMYALVADRVEFVQLLLNNGMPLDRFLTIQRLEELYTTDRGPPHTLQFLVQDVIKDPGPHYKLKLPHIGLIIEKLMGIGYRATYSRQDFRRKYKLYTSHMSRKHPRFSTVGQKISRGTLLNDANGDLSAREEKHEDSRRFTCSACYVGKTNHFQYPFDELFLWAVLTKRHEMAMCMWRQSEEQMAKALIGFKLNKALAKEAEEDYLEVEVSQQFRNNAKKFETLAYDLLETCYQTDDDLTLQLLTYELKRWSRKTCLSLAAMSNFKKFIAHPCCQILLTDLWLGGLRIRRKAHLKVVLGILLPPVILFLPFKTKEQLMLQAQTAEEFHENRPDVSDIDDECSYASDSTSSDEDDLDDDDSGSIVRGDGAAGTDGEAQSSAEHKLSSASSRGGGNASRLSSIVSGVRPLRKITHPRLSSYGNMQEMPVWFSKSSRAFFNDNHMSSITTLNIGNDDRSGADQLRRVNSHKLISATKASLNTAAAESISYECAMLTGETAADADLAPKMRTAHSHHGGMCQMLLPEATPRNSTDIGHNAALLMANEHDSAALLAHDARKMMNRDRSINGLKQQLGRTQTSLGLGLISKRFNKFQPERMDGSRQIFNREMSVDIKRVSLRRNQQLSRRKKVREFYQAPIACFWSFVICYIVFLAAYTYVVLVKFPIDNHISWPEKFVVAFIVTFGCDQIRRVLLQEPNRLYSKWKVYVQQSAWDCFTCFACVMFLAAFLIRFCDWLFVEDYFGISIKANDTGFNNTTSLLVPTMNHNGSANIVLSNGTKVFYSGAHLARDVGRVLYCCNIVFWYMRLLHLMTVSSLLGPYITMYGKMVAKMLLLSNILAVVLISFGVFRQSILFPTERWEWISLRNVTYKPYFMLYGELYSEEIDMCLDSNELCVAGHFLVPLFMTIYLLLAIIVFVNMMIAAFNFVFIQVNSQSQLIWKFQRYEQVMEYEQQPFLPPPLIVVTHIFLIAKYIYRRIWRRDKIYRFEHSLKLFLSEAEVDRLHDFERECVEHMFTKKEAENLNSTDVRVKHISDRLESLTQKVDSLFDRCSANRLLMLVLHDRLSGGVTGGGAAPLLDVVDPRRNSWSGSAQDLRGIDNGSPLGGGHFSRGRQRGSYTELRSTIPSRSPLRNSYNLNRAAALNLDVGHLHQRTRTTLPTSAAASGNAATAAAMSRSVTWTTALRSGNGNAGRAAGDTVEMVSPTSAFDQHTDFRPLTRVDSEANRSFNSGIIVTLPPRESLPGQNVEKL